MLARVAQLGRTCATIVTCFAHCEYARRLRIPGTKAVKHDVKAVVADSTAVGSVGMHRHVYRFGNRLVSLQALRTYTDVY